MGKKRVIKKEGGATGVDQELKSRSLASVSKKKLTNAVLYIHSTFNNTLMNLTDADGNTVTWSSSGSIGFKGAKKGTPFAASKVAELLADKAKTMGVNNIDIVIKGVGAGRESAIRSLAAKGVEINTIRDMTPVPHNGPKPKKPRRV